MHLQSVRHRRLPWQLKPLACRRLGKQPNHSDGGRLDNWTASSGETPHQVGWSIKTNQHCYVIYTFLGFSRVPYPFRLAASTDTLAVISMVCCETWQVVTILLRKQNEENWFSFKAPLLALRLYSLHSGNLQRTVKQLEDGRTVGEL